MRSWLLLLSGLIVWTLHFFGIYIAASLFPGTDIAKWLTGGLTLIALGLLAALMLPPLRRSRTQNSESLRPWLDRLALLGGVLSAIAVVYQGLPALMV